MDIPKSNFVGELQEACQRARIALPVYTVPADSNDRLFKCTCTLKDWVSHGTSSTKMFAKQNAAKEMLKLIDYGELLSCTTKNDLSPVKSSISKLHEYCMKEKKNVPLFAELSEEGELFCIKCTVDDFSAIGKANSKKEAKEKAAFEVAEHFNVHKYYDDLIKIKELNKSRQTAVQELYAYCQKNNLDSPTFVEDEIKEKNKIKYHVICSVGDLKQESWAHAKKAAKHEAAALVMQALSNITPKNSPSKTTLEARQEEKTEGNANISNSPQVNPKDNTTKRKSELLEEASSPSKLQKFFED